MNCQLATKCAMNYQLANKCAINVQWYSVDRWARGCVSAGCDTRSTAVQCVRRRCVNNIFPVLFTTIRHLAESRIRPSMPVSVSIAGRSPKVVIQVVELEESHYSDSGASLTTILETFWLFSLCSSLNILVIGTLWADWSWAAGAAPNAIEFKTNYSMITLFNETKTLK